VQYNITQLIERHDLGKPFKFLFFWGDKPNKDGSLGAGCFSQWWAEHPFDVGGFHYATAEHWMMAGKARLFNDDAAAEAVLAARTPAEAKSIGRTVANFEEAQWNTAKYELVKTGNLHKFSQHPELRDFLLKTGDRILVEASPVDRIWGIGLAKEHPDAGNPGRWQGENLLGFALMEVRDKLLALMLLCFACLPVSAQTEAPLDTVRRLAGIEVSYQADKRAPLTFLNLQNRALEARSTGQEPAFLLAETPSVTAYSDAGHTQGYAYFRLRGIDQTRINMTLDGVPLNEPEDQGAYFSNYPDILNSIDRLQIQRGVGTSKNGAASYGGSIQLFSPNLHEARRTVLGAGYGAFNTMRAFAEYNSGVHKQKALYARVSQIYSDGYKYNSANNSRSMFVSSSLFSDKSVWKINLLAGNQRNQLAWLGVSDSLIAIDPRTNANRNERDHFTQCLVQLQNSRQVGRFSTLQSSVYYTFAGGNYDFNLNGFLGLPETGELYNYAFQSGLYGFFGNYIWAKNDFSITTGLHGNAYQRRHTGSEKTLGRLYRNTGYRKELSAFGKVEYRLGDFTLFADLQYRYTDFNYRGAVSLAPFAWRFFNPKAGASYALNRRALFYYSLGGTGREPTRNDLFGGNDDLLADSLGRPLIAIKNPESVTDQELGFRFQSEKTALNLNAFYMDFRDEIVLDGKFGPNGLALTNAVEKSFRAGLEFSLTQQISRRLDWIGQASLNYSRIRAEAQRFSPILTPRFILHQELLFHTGAWQVAASVRYQDRAFIDFANTVQVDAYWLANARIQYAYKRYRFSVFANNFTNTRYFNNGYVDFDGTAKYFVQAPANFYFSIQYSW
jgi:iron complex outermembrane recepter protein